MATLLTGNLTHAGHEQDRAVVCVLGTKLVDDLFRGLNPVGQRIQIGGRQLPGHRHARGNTGIEDSFNCVPSPCDGTTPLWRNVRDQGCPLAGGSLGQRERGREAGSHYARGIEWRKYTEFESPLLSRAYQEGEKRSGNGTDSGRSRSLCNDHSRRSRDYHTDALRGARPAS